jgi:hypothetical protein
LQRGNDHRLAQVHAQRRNLHHQHVLVLVHDEAAEEIAFGVHHTERRGARQVFLPHGQRGADTLLEKVLLHLHAIRRQHADVDLGLGVVKADAEEALAMVLHLHDLAVGGGLGQAQSGAVIDPRMACNDAVGFPGTKDDGGQ